GGRMLAAVRLAFGAWGLVIAVTVGLAAPLDEDLAPLRSTGTEGFPLVQGPRQFEFPQDHGPHPEFRQEWWYLTGNLTSAEGERFGFELTIFRVGLTPPAATGAVGTTQAAGIARAVGTPTSPASPVSPWRAHQVYVAHFAITDAARNTFRFVQKYERDALGLAGAVADPFRVWLDDWQIGGGPPWTVHAQQKDYELKLEVQSLAPPILNGDHGLSVKAS